MIEKEAGKEPAEGGGGGGSHRLGDAPEMRAVVLAGFGGLSKLRVTRKAMPEPQDGELKIRVKAWSTVLTVMMSLLLAFWALPSPSPSIFYLLFPPELVSCAPPAMGLLLETRRDGSLLPQLPCAS
ncbi:Synaptic Vesicle Membrane Protein Vat-1-Like [Manis pentadactyla]|nr:Synaptic Vesicle Membrane Protein Vat-1-Like [Manis pentadactyla]